MAEPWWQTGVFYQIYPRSFADSSGDGVGDLEGICGKLDYLAWLGVDAVWLSPIYPSPMADFGYDVSDYGAIDPRFGDFATFDRLLDEAHARGLRVVLDWVPNHTSDQHPWFKESRASRDNPKRDWYIWRDEPNNWVAAFSNDPAWTFDERTGQWYLHLFLPQQPDLNWANPQVEQAMQGVLRFWLDRGVDGFRADVIHLIGKDPTLPDDPPEVMGMSRVSFHHHPSTHELLRGIREVLDSYPGERMIVGEINLENGAKIAEYYGRGDQLHLAFNFVPLYAEWDAEVWRAVISDMEAEYRPVEAWPTWVLSNHDQPRHRTRYGTAARARAAAVLLLTLRGTPFLYAGEELGLEDAEIPPERVVDPGGRDGCRAPIPWDGSPTHGWASADAWLPWPPEPDRRNAEALRHGPGSILQLYRRLLACRKASPALRSGDFALLDAPEGVLAYVRLHAAGPHAVLINFTDQPQDAPVDGVWRVEVASDADGEGTIYSGVLGSTQAMVLRENTCGSC
jgi:alpha-glucosidase